MLSSLIINTDMSVVLGKMQRIIDLRTVWPHEALDFTRWLSEGGNLSLLGEAIDLDIELEEVESPVGSFSVDIFASENGTGRKIIIENQLEDTNHDHLGKLITYASGKGAEVIIWVVKRARDEHRQAIEWLNQHTDSSVDFFLVEIELWQIDNSLKAPKFNVVEKPNDWAKSMKTGGLSETARLELEFWQEFVETMKSNSSFVANFSARKPLPHHWYDIGLGSSAYHLGLTVNSQKKRIASGLYIHDDRELFQKFQQHKVEIEQRLGHIVAWIEAPKASRIAVCKSFLLRDRSQWSDAFDWYLNMALAFKEIATLYGK